MSALDTELAAWCASYVGVFSDYDAPAISQHWAFPNVVVQAGRRFSFKQAEDFTANTEKLLSFYRAQGVAKAERALLGHMAMAEDIASIEVEDRMVDASGALIAGWKAAYVLQRIDGDWRAIMAVADGETAAWAARGTPLGKG